jgi:hypothetical protein
VEARKGLFEVIIADGRPLLTFVGLSLVLFGLFAIFQASTGHLLPHDVAYLGLDAEALCIVFDCRIVEFMIHDRISFGGALIAIGIIYIWLVAFPLKERLQWAWWVLLLSSIAGFASFLTYLGYGYLDTWHGFATLLLLPIFVLGLFLTYPTSREKQSFRQIFSPSAPLSLRSRAGAGRAVMLLMALGMFASGLTLMTVGSTEIFVPQDLRFMQLQVPDLQGISPGLVSLIAHDRAGFGGALFSLGVALLITIWCATPSKSLWQALLISGGVGFGCAIGVHFVVGYTDFTHLLPAYIGAVVLAIGLALSYKPMMEYKA